MFFAFLLISMFLFVLFGKKVEEFMYAYVEKIYVNHADKDPMVTCIITHLIPLWMMTMTWFALTAFIEQAKSLMDIGDIVMLVALGGTTVFLGWVSKNSYESSNRWEARINAQNPTE